MRDVCRMETYIAECTGKKRKKRKKRKKILMSCYELLHGSGLQCGMYFEETHIMQSAQEKKGKKGKKGKKREKRKNV